MRDAPAPTQPAGWAFLPPLQRQVADAPPATLRPAFVSTLPTRSVPASLGAMGHLVDDTAPSGTVAVDDRTLGAPVQRAVATDLTLLPRPAPAVPAARPVAQRADDSALADAPADSPVVSREVEVMPDAAAPALAAEAPDSAPTLTEGPPTAADPSTPVNASTTDGPAAPAPPTAFPLSAGAPPGDVAVTPLVRPTLQRSAVDGARAAGAPSSSPVAPATPSGPIRRPGLGAPLSQRPLQRATEGSAATGAPPGGPAGTHWTSPSGPTSAEPTSAGPAFSEPMVSDATSSDLTAAGPTSGGSPLAPDRADQPSEASVQRDHEEPGHAPLLSASPLDSALGSAEASAFGDAASAAGHSDPSSAHAGPASPASALPVAVQRAAAGSDEPGTHVVDAYAATEPGLPDEPFPSHSSAATAAVPAGGLDHLPTIADPDPSIGRLTGQEHTLPAQPQGVFLPSRPGQRTVPLFGVQRLTPSISAPSHVSARRVVVARAIAPEPPPPIATAHPTARDASSSRAAGASGGASTGTGWSLVAPGTTAAAPGGDGAEVSLGWPPPEASVSRLVEAPGAGGGHDEQLPGIATMRGRAPAASLQRAASNASTPSAASVASRASLASQASATSTVARPDPAMPVVSREAGAPAQHAPMPLVAAPPGLEVVQRAIDASVQRAETATPATEASPEPAEPEASAPEPDGSTGGAHTSVAPAPPAPPGENVEQLARKLYGPLVRRIKAELLLDRERRGIRIDGI